MKKYFEKYFQLFATALTLEGGDIQYRPLKIGYFNQRNQTSKDKTSYIDKLLQHVNSYVGISKRSVEDDSVDEIIDDVNIIAVQYIGLFTDFIKDDISSKASMIMKVKNLDQQFSKAGKIQSKVSSVLRNKLINIIEYV